MTTREQITHEKVEALLEMIAEEGATKSGDIPTPHIRELSQSKELTHAREVREAHAKSNRPPGLVKKSGKDK